ncbi:MAG: UTP--glucose-1-phosphate uridylyltransferase [Neomegalonema sp.]|nr:UTP--glucose-1-phosphate uridylyltransferase [Neomegalonema sp.]
MGGQRIRTAVFPVAGLGTRFLPAAKAVPKELAAVVDKPVLQYAVEEARAAGCERFVFVSSMGKSALETHFDRNLELERTLEAKGKTALLEAARAAALPDGALVVVRQHAPLGLGHAVWCARQAVGDEPFAVLLPDELLWSEPRCLAEMVDAHAAVGGAVIATMEVPRALTKKYGILDPGGDEDARRLTPARGFVEKPEPEVAPSTHSLIGRYVLPAETFDLLEAGERGAGGEIQLTDAIDKLVGKMPVHGFRFTGQRYDCGSPGGFVKANLAMGMARPELRAELLAFAREMAGGDG